MPDTLLDTWNKLKREADKSDADVLDRLDKAYVSSYVRLEPEIQALIEQIEAMQKSGKVTQSQVKNSQAYKNLIREVRQELDDYSAYLRTEVSTSVNESAKQGLQAGDLLLVTAIALSLGVDANDVPKDTLKQLDSLDFLSKYLAKDSPLFERINGLSNYHGEQIAEGILQRVGDGMNPRLIGEWMIDAYGMGENSALNIARTAQLYSYRNSTALIQSANADLLEGGVWCSELDDTVCLSCICLHGTVYPAGTVCNDHHRGRCDIIPWVKGMPNPIEVTGEQWFNNQSEDTQKSMMGDAKYSAFKEGKFEFNQLTKDYNDEVYGIMKGEASLKDLIGG